MQTLSEIPTAFRELFTTIHHTRMMKKDTFLFQEGTIANEIFMIKSGIVQISKIIPDGRELTLQMCTNGDIVGAADLFSSVTKYLVSGRVVESGEVGVIMKDSLEEKLSHNLPLAMELMKWMGLQNRKMQTKFSDLVLHGKKGALFSTLIRISHSFGIKTNEGIVISLPLTNQELANFCGTSREVVNRLLSELRKADVISINKGKITIHDLNYLKKEIDCENCPNDICRID